MGRRAKSKPHIMMSGFDGNCFAGVDLGRQIAKLGGVLFDSSNYELSCTHLICYKLSRSEKFLCACAAGVWILVPRYLEDCLAAKSWLPEADYEWTSKHSAHPLLHKLPRCFYNAPRRNRLAVEATGKGRFSGFIATVVMENVQRKLVYERLLSSGGAIVVGTSNFVLNGRGLKQLTIVLVEMECVAKVQLALEQNIPCIYPAFLRSFLILDKEPKSKFFDVLSYNPTRDPLMLAIEQENSRPICSARFGRVLDNCLRHDSKCDSNESSGSSKQAQCIADLTSRKRGRQRLLGDQDSSKRTKLALKETNNDKLTVGPMDHFLLRSSKPDVNYSLKLEPAPLVDTRVIVQPAVRKRAVRTSINAVFNDSALGQSSERAATVTATNGEVKARPNKLVALSDSDGSGVLCASSKFSNDGCSTTSVPRSIIIAAVHEFLQSQNAFEVIGSTFGGPVEKKSCVPFSTMRTLAACEEIGRWAMNIYDSYCRYTGFEQNGLEYLSKIVVTKKNYPPASTVAHLLWVMQKNVNSHAIVLCVQRFWRSLITVHPPTAPGFQLYYQKILCGKGTNAATWDLFDGWGNILGLLTLEDLNGNTHKRFNNQLALQFVIDILMPDFLFTSQRSSSYYKPTPGKSSLITKLVWPSSEVGTYNLSVEKLVQRCIQLWDSVDSTNAKMFELCLQLMFMVAETCNSHDCRHAPSQSSPPFVLGTSAEKLSLGVAKQLVGAGVELVTICKWLPRIRPRWLKLKVSTLLIDHFTGLTPMHKQGPSQSPVSLTSIANSMFVRRTEEESLPEQQMAKAISCSIRYRKLKRSSTVSSNDGACVSAAVGHQVVSSKMLAKVNGKGETQLHLACMKNNVERVRNLLNLPDVNVNAQDYAGWSALHEVCNRGHLECLRELLAYRPKRTIRGYFSKDSPNERGLNLLVATPDGITPLHDAVMCGRIEVARILLRHGGPSLLEARLVNGRTPMDCTVWPKMKATLQEFQKRAKFVDELDDGIAMDETEMECKPLLFDDSVCLRRTQTTNMKDLVACYRLSMQCIATYLTVTKLGQLSDILARRIQRSTEWSEYKHRGNLRLVAHLATDLEQLLGLPQLCDNTQRGSNSFYDKLLDGILLSCKLV